MFRFLKSKLKERYNMTENKTLHKLFDVPDNTILNPEDISKLLNMHVESVRRWCRQGKLVSYSFGNKYIITGSDFKKFMRNSKVKLRWEQLLNE